MSPKSEELIQDLSDRVVKITTILEIFREDFARLRAKSEAGDEQKHEIDLTLTKMDARLMRIEKECDELKKIGEKPESPAKHRWAFYTAIATGALALAGTLLAGTLKLIEMALTLWRKTPTP